jgi:hypothetical protein
MENQAVPDQEFPHADFKDYIYPFKYIYVD